MHAKVAEFGGDPPPPIYGIVLNSSYKILLPLPVSVHFLPLFILANKQSRGVALINACINLVLSTRLY